MAYEAVIGLECHIQLRTRTKMFCECPAEFGATANSNVCPVCLGLPGALPVTNRAAIDSALRLGLALGSDVRHESVFARKNYFYPDMPKNYQITQYDLPLCEGGALPARVGEEERRFALTRIHVEEDTGKSFHPEKLGDRRVSRVDFNRAGVPLLEMVTQPVFRSPAEAAAFLSSLRRLVRWLDISDGEMEKGHLRCDANVSIRSEGAKELGTKTEIKNLNSFKNAKAALEYEFARQIRVIEAGDKIIQSTLLWDVEKNQTRLMRTKEEAHDYRYFPEPDLPPVKVSDEWIGRVKAQIPELPAAKRERFATQYGLSDYDAKVLSFDRAMADFFEEAAKGSGKPKPVANWLVNELNKILNEKKIEMSAVKATPKGLNRLIELVESGQLTGSSAKETFAEMVDKGIAPDDVLKEKGKIGDAGALEEAAKAAIAAGPKAVADFKAGKDAALKSLLGGIMKQTKGRADPKLAEEVLRRLLS